MLPEESAEEVEEDKAEERGLTGLGGSLVAGCTSSFPSLPSSRTCLQFPEREREREREREAESHDGHVREREGSQGELGRLLPLTDDGHSSHSEEGVSGGGGSLLDDRPD